MKWPWQKARLEVRPWSEVPVVEQPLAPVVFSEVVPVKERTYCEIRRGVSGKQTVWETHAVCGPKTPRSRVAVDHVVTTGHWVERP